MKFGYTILYVKAVRSSLDFYHKAFGFEIKFITDEHDYGELITGETTLALASLELREQILGYPPSLNPTNLAAEYELAFVTEDIEADFAQALAAGAKLIKHPQQKPWGQIVGYVKTPDNTLIEICTPVEN